MSALTHVAADAQVLTIQLGEEQYGLPILQVQEIRAFAPVTPVPNTPPYLRGMMNLRGAVIPILDLRTRLGVDHAPRPARSVIVVVDVGQRVAGLVVDAVSDVAAVTAEASAPLPSVGIAPGGYVKGLIKEGERLVMVLDLETTLGGDL
jgi:purine-binding chemotaxis protein CheW